MVVRKTEKNPYETHKKVLALDRYIDSILLNDLITKLFWALVRSKVSSAAAIKHTVAT